MTRQLGIELTDELIERMVLERSGSRAPADLVDAIVTATMATPQRRASLLPALPRIAGSRPAWLLVGALVALLVLGAALVVGSYLLRLRTPLDPAALMGTWIPVVPPGPDDSTLDITIGPPTIGIPHNLPTNGFQIHGSFYPRVSSSWSFLEPNRIELALDLTMQSWNCRAGDLGSYTFSLSSDSRTLTLTPVDDPCAARAAILGRGWARTDVTNLSPGRHIAPIFRPFGTGPNPQFSYTVPDGWADHYEAPDVFVLPHDQSSISLYPNLRPAAETATCTVTAAEVGQTPAATVEWLTTIPGLVMTEPIPLTIGGLNGLMVDISVDPGWTSACSTNTYGNTFLVPPLYVSPDTAARYILLDRGDGRSLLIDLEVQDKGTWDAAIAAAMPIIESFDFTR